MQRDRWGNQKRTKNEMSKTCNSHRYCSIDYEWKIPPYSNRDTGPSDPNNPREDMKLPQEEKLQDEEEYIKYVRITEQAIDDWIA